MSIYYMPVVLTIEADTLEEAQNAIDEWCEGVDIEADLPEGTEDIDVSPSCEYNDEGQRLMYLPAIEDEDEEIVENTDEEDDFNDADEF